MAQGLKSLTGGNLHAAMHRLGKAKQALLDGSLAPHTPPGLAPAAAAGTAAAAPSAAEQVLMQPGDAAGPDSMDVELQASSQQPQQAAAGPPEAVGRAVQLATICGCLGDCYQRVGEADQADQQYKEAVAAVQPYSDDYAEAAHAMSVSLNK